MKGKHKVRNSLASLMAHRLFFFLFLFFFPFEDWGLLAPSCSNLLGQVTVTLRVEEGHTLAVLVVRNLERHVLDAVIQHLSTDHTNEKEGGES